MRHALSSYFHALLRAILTLSVLHQSYILTQRSSASTTYNTFDGDEDESQDKSDQLATSSQYGFGTSDCRGDTYGDGCCRSHQLQETAECTNEGENQVQHDSNAIRQRGPTDRGLGCFAWGKGECDFSLLSVSAYNTRYSHFADHFLQGYWLF